MPAQTAAFIVDLSLGGGVCMRGAPYHCGVGFNVITGHVFFTVFSH